MPKASPVFATAARSFAAKPVVPSGDVVIPELADTLEWVLDSPPTVHQFDEPPVSFTNPNALIFTKFTLILSHHLILFVVSQIFLFFLLQIVVEIEHLENLVVAEDH